MYKRNNFFLAVFLLFSTLSAQIFIQADPFYLLEQEKKSFSLDKNNPKNFLIRPVLNHTDNSLSGIWSIGFRTELFFNNNAPNLENTSDRWIGKGMSFFQGLRLAYTNKFLSLSLEPYYFISQNKDYSEPWQEYFASHELVLDQPWREPKFSKLNDNRPHGAEPYRKAGIREAQLYLHYNGLGIGYSNANMWWGLGLSFKS